MATATIEELTDKQKRVVDALFANGPLTFRELADDAKVSLGYAHDVIGLLRKKGLVFKFYAHRGRGMVECLPPGSPPNFRRLPTRLNEREWVEARGADWVCYRACPSCGRLAKRQGTIGEKWALCPVHGEVHWEATT